MHNFNSKQRDEKHEAVFDLFRIGSHACNGVVLCLLAYVTDEKPAAGGSDPGVG